MTLDMLITELEQLRDQAGGDAEVHVIPDGRDILIGAGHVSRDAALAAAAASGPDSAAHGLYLASRALGDVRALRRGRLPQRLARRAITRRAARAVWGS